jgi:hypothetical protein
MGSSLFLSPPNALGAVPGEAGWGGVSRSKSERRLSEFRPHPHLALGELTTPAQPLDDGKWLGITAAEVLRGKNDEVEVIKGSMGMEEAVEVSCHVCFQLTR